MLEYAGLMVWERKLLWALSNWGVKLTVLSSGTALVTGVRMYIYDIEVQGLSFLVEAGYIKALHQLGQHTVYVIAQLGLEFIERDKARFDLATVPERNLMPGEAHI